MHTTSAIQTYNGRVKIPVHRVTGQNLYSERTMMEKSPRLNILSYSINKAAIIIIINYYYYFIIIIIIKYVCSFELRHLVHISVICT